MADERKKREPRDAWIGVKCTRAERSQWQALAERQGLPLADLIRTLLGSDRVAKSRGRTKQADPRLVAEIARIGNNLNQLSRWVNAAGVVDIEVLILLRAIEQELSMALDRHKGSGHDD